MLRALITASSSVVDAAALGVVFLELVSLMVSSSVAAAAGREAGFSLGGTPVVH